MATITVGVDGATAGGLTDYTLIHDASPADGTGTIDHLECTSPGGGRTSDFGSFYGSDPTFSTRGVAQGLSTGNGKNTWDAPGDFTAFNINTGDYIGRWCSNAQYADNAAGTAIWHISGDYIPCTSQGFTKNTTSYTQVSAYGTGTTGGAPSFQPYQTLAPPMMTRPMQRGLVT